MGKNEYNKERCPELKGAYWWVSDQDDGVKWRSEAKFFPIS